MIDDDVIERVYDVLSPNPQRCVDMAKILSMDSDRLKFVLSILKRQTNNYLYFYSKRVETVENNSRMVV